MALLLWAITKAERALNRLYLLLIIPAALLVYPFFAVNLITGPSIDYMKWLLDLDRNKSASGMIMLRDYYSDIGDVAAADSLELLIRDRRDIIGYSERAMNHAVSGRFPQAMAIVDTVFALDPYSRESYNLRGAVYLEMGQYDSAIADFETSLEMEPYDFRVLVNLARAYYKTGRYERMMTHLRRAEELNPESDLVLQAFAMGYLAKQRYDSAYIYGRRLLEVDSSAANGYLSVGLFFYAIHAYDSSKAYLKRYADMVGPGPDRDRALNLLNKIRQEEQE
jgi:tetratricopeptide (TPR) repeat protein